MDFYFLAQENEVHQQRWVNSLVLCLRSTKCENRSTNLKKQSFTLMCEDYDALGLCGALQR